MLSSLVTRLVPNADPDFVDLLSRLPEPPPSSDGALGDHLRTLHQLFLEKRRAAETLDVAAWSRIVEHEVKMITYADII